MMNVQFRNRIAILIRLGSLDPLPTLPRRNLLMPLALPGAEVGEYLHQRLLLHSRDRTRREAQFAFAILVQQPILDHLLEQFRLLGIFSIPHHLLDRLQGLLAVLKDKLHQLVDIKQLVRCGKFFAVKFAVKVLHGESILAMKQAARSSEAILYFGLTNRPSTYVDGSA